MLFFKIYNNRLTIINTEIVKKNDTSRDASQIRNVETILYRKYA